MSYQPVIGLEIHCELLTSSKVFCACKNGFGGGANTRVCPVCAGMPGALPILNRDAVRLAARAGLATDCAVNRYSAFDRKNYFYPDLPKAYQITQFRFPICGNGHIDVIGGRRIRINRIHIEEDAGKLVHEAEISMADLNRCGVPLIEIVTEPDLRSAAEAQDFVLKLGRRLKYAGVCDARMEQGSLRVDVNISLMPRGSDTLGTRAEIKNLNSVRSICRAIEYETERQSGILKSGGSVRFETRRYDEKRGVTCAMRSKEDARDYRYFPEPDIPPVLLSDADIETIRAELPELPRERYLRYTNEYRLPDEDARLLIARKEFSDFYDAAAAVVPEYKLIANLMLGEISHLINETGADITDAKCAPADIAAVAKLTADGVVTKGAARELCAILFTEGGKPEAVAKTRGYITDSDGLGPIVDAVLKEHAGLVEQYKNGNEKLFGYIMGQAMRACGKGADPAAVKQEILIRI